MTDLAHGALTLSRITKRFPLHIQHPRCVESDANEQVS